MCLNMLPHPELSGGITTLTVGNNIILHTLLSLYLKPIALVYKPLQVKEMSYNWSVNGT